MQQHYQPHAPLKKHYKAEEGKQPFLRELFDRAAPHYEGIARWGWFGTGQSYRRRALRRAGLRPGMALLDVASGTGPTARAARDIMGSEQGITCLEPSAGMIAESRKQLACTHVQAGADRIPLQDNFYDFLSMGFALRHVEDLLAAFREFHRVLKPGGRVLIMDETLPSRGWQRACMRLYFKHMLPGLSGLFTRNPAAREMMAYYWDTLETMAPPEVVTTALEKAGFIDVRHDLLLGMFSEYHALKPAD